VSSQAFSVNIALRKQNPVSTVTPVCLEALLSLRYTIALAPMDEHRFQPRETSKTGTAPKGQRLRRHDPIIAAPASNTRHLSDFEVVLNVRPTSNSAKAMPPVNAHQQRTQITRRAQS
jgi:hypothetical protein